MPVRTVARPVLGHRSGEGQVFDVSGALDEVRTSLVGHLSGGFADYWTLALPVVPAVPASMREVAGFTDPSDVDTLRRVQWAAVDEAADDW